MGLGELLSIIREEGAAFNPEMPGIGEVESVNPLTVKYNDITLDKDNLLINKNYPWRPVGFDTLQEEFELLDDQYFTLQPGVLVLLVPVAGKYLIVCEVGEA